ncbi:MAG: Mor transcription activator family protein [Oscillospiraceae bacterium]
MNLLNEITLEDLDQEQRELAECIGLDAYKKLVATYAGESITIRMPDRLTIRQRNSKICEEFNGYNFTELAHRYKLTERQIRYIVATEVTRRRNEPLENQISFFDE